MGILVFALTFLIVLVLVLGIWMIASGDNKQEVVRRRMEAVRKAERRGDVSLGLKLARDEMLSSVPAVHRLMLHWQWSVRLQERIAQAGLKMKAGKLILMSACLGLGTFVFAGVFYPQFWVGVLLGATVACIPYGVVSYLRQKRLQQFEERFPEALDLLGRAVRAGHAFTTGLEMIAKESAEPIASEFRTTFEEQNFGLPLRDALLNMTERIPSIDVRFFVTALLDSKRNRRKPRGDSRWPGARHTRPLPHLSRSPRAHGTGKIDGGHPDRSAYFHADRAHGIESHIHEGFVSGSQGFADFDHCSHHAGHWFLDHLENYSH